MQFRPSEDEEPEINLIPLIDVLVLTLIFLLVTTSFSKEARLSVRLPEAAAEAKDERTSVHVTLDERGQIYVGETELLNATPEVLRGALARAAAGQKEPLIVIHADRQTPHGAVVKVMDAARRLGYSHLSFATQQAAAGAAR